MGLSSECHRVSYVLKATSHSKSATNTALAGPHDQMGEKVLKQLRTELASFRLHVVELAALYKIPNSAYWLLCWSRRVRLRTL